MRAHTCTRARTQDCTHVCARMHTVDTLSIDLSLSLSPRGSRTPSHVFSSFDFSITLKVEPVQDFPTVENCRRMVFNRQTIVFQQGALQKREKRV